jgi:glycosidase
MHQNCRSGFIVFVCARRFELTPHFPDAMNRFLILIPTLLFFLFVVIPQRAVCQAPVWHLPGTFESQISTEMRVPLYEVKGSNTTIYQGFFKNGGANGDQNGGAVFYRVTPRGAAPGAWQSVALSFHANVGANQYWKATIPTAAMGSTDVIEYYLQVTFTGGSPATTYLHGPDLGGSSASLSEASARANPFSIRNRPGWIFHAGNRVIAGDGIVVRVKSGYIGPDNSPASLWSTGGAIYFTTDGSIPTGTLGVGSGTTLTAPLVFSGTEGDNSGNGNAAAWEGTMDGVLDGLALGAEVKYRIGLWNSDTDEEKFADHAAGANNTVFTYQNGVVGAPMLSVDGRNGNYTTSKVFVDEVAGDSVPLRIVFSPGESNVTVAEVFTNLNRRDRAGLDGNGDQYPDGISGADGNSINAGDDGHYYKAYPMVSEGAGTYSLVLPAEKTGAYRLTARWKVSGDPNWRWYSNVAANRRDHAITVSPKDARDIVLYEINVLNVEATGSTFAQRSTIEDMHNAAGSPHNGNNRWDLDYLKALGANWLWFQPIHPNGYDGREPTEGYGSGSALYDPGSPYAVKNFFEVNPIFTKDFSGNPLNPADTMNAGNRAAAMGAWQEFVDAADDKSVGIMLDAPFNHTSFDVELAQVGLDLFKPDGATWSMTDEIRNRDARFFSKSGDYGDRASGAGNIAAGPDRFDFGKWNDVKDVFFGRYDALVEVDSEPERSSYTSEGDWFDATDVDWTSNDFVQGGIQRNTTKRVWEYFGRYATHWLEKTRPSGQNRNSSTEPGLTLAQRYEWDARGIDGLRCDFGQGLPPQAWEYMINLARSLKWNFVMMSESLDGGAVTYRSNRHFDILNENIVFPLKSAGDKWAYRSIYEDRRNAYGEGLVLSNTTSHDEENYNDPWEALIRFGVSSTIDGVPMIFPGQEQGISRTFGYDHYELNFGKTIPHFKRYNSMMPIWNDTNFGNSQLFHVYSGMANARLFSEALRSSNRWFLDGDGNNSMIHAVAKYEVEGGSPAFSEVVIAFSNLDRNSVQADQFRIPSGLAPLLGVKDDRIYNVRNIAAYLNPAIGMIGRRDVWKWPGQGYSGAQLKSSGFLVSLNRVPTSDTTADAPETTVAAAWNQKPFEAQYLKVYDVTPPPSPVPEAAHYVIGSEGYFTWTPNGGADDHVVAYDVVVRDGDGDVVSSGRVVDGSNRFDFSGFIGGIYRAMVTAVSEAGVVSDVPASSDAGEPNAGSATSATILLSAVGDEDGDGQSNEAEQFAGTDPLIAASVLKVRGIVVSGGDVVVNVATVSGKRYQMESSFELDGGWVDVGPVRVATGVSTEFTDVGGAGEGRKFYRVRVVP